MTSRLYPAGHLNATNPSGPAVCERCHKKHPSPWKHIFRDERGKVVWSQCGQIVGDDYCPNVALVHNGKFGLLCAIHSQEDPDHIEPRVKGGKYARFITDADREAMREASKPLAKTLGQPESLKPVPPVTLNPKATRRFYVRSRSRPPYEHCVQFIDDWLACSCEAGITNQHCWHKEVVSALIEIGVKEVSV